MSIMALTLSGGNTSLASKISTLLIYILQKPATPVQIAQMLQANRFYIKTVVDIHHQIQK